MTRLVAALAATTATIGARSRARADEPEEQRATTSKSKKDGPRVAIVGAGIAGLACAQTLQKAGIDVTVFEARDRIGGRVWTDDSWGYAVDLGASWIHGVRANPVSDLADGAKIEMFATDYDNTVVYGRDKQPLDPQQVEEAWEAWLALWKAIEEHAADLEDDISVGKALKLALREESLDREEERLVNWFTTAMITSPSGEEPDALSLLYAEDDESFGGGDKLFVKGYRQIAELLAKDVSVRLSTDIDQVNWDAHETSLTIGVADVPFDYVVVTVPLGVLKQGALRFHPKLPLEKRAAIAALGVGTLNKYIMEFDRRFWPEEPDFFGYASDKKGEFATFLNMSKFTDTPTLMAFAGGDFARGTEDQSDEKVLDMLLEIVGDDHDEPAKITRFMRTKWNSDPFAYGSYSHVPVGSTSAHYDTLASPLKGRLFFAGEATSRKHRGTVHGALLSGDRAAKEVLGAIAAHEE